MRTNFCVYVIKTSPGRLIFKTKSLLTGIFMWYMYTTCMATVPIGVCLHATHCLIVRMGVYK